MVNYSTLPDNNLVKLFAQGDNKAFETLLMRYKDRLYNYIFNLTHQAYLTDDIFQETFEKAIINIKENRYNDNGKFFAWISRIAYNLFIDYHRQIDNENLISDDANEISIFETNVKISEQYNQDTYFLEEIIQSVESLIDELPEDQRNTIIMRYYQNLSFKEIAERQSVSINTALGRMHYAIDRLKKLVGERHITNDIESAY